MVINHNCLHYYINLLRMPDHAQRSSEQSEHAVQALHNVIRTMSISRHNMVCGEDFSRLDFGNIPLNQIEFSYSDYIPTVFDSSKISLSNLHQLRDGHYRPITSVAISNDGEYLATGSMEPEGKVCIWNTWTKCLVKTILNPLSWHSGYGIPGIEYLCFSNDGSILCMGNKFGVVVYNLITNVFEIKIEAAVFHNSECLKLSSYYEQVCDLEKVGEALSYYYIISDYDYGSSAYFERVKYSIPSLMPRSTWIKLEPIRFLSDCFIFALRSYRTYVEKKSTPNTDIVYERERRKIEFKLDLANKKYLCNNVNVSSQKENIHKTHMYIYELMKPVRETSYNNRFNATQLSDFEFEILDNSTKMKSVICLGQTNQIFIHKYKEGLVSRAFNEPSILWDALSLAIISVLDNQLPPAYADSRHRVKRLSVCWDNYRYVSVNEYCIDLSRVIRKCKSQAERAILTQMFRSLKQISIKTRHHLNDLLPYGMVEGFYHLFYCQYNEFLIIFDLESNSLTTIIKLNFNYNNDAFLNHRNDHYYDELRIRSVALSEDANSILIRRETTVNVLLRTEQTWTQSFVYEGKDIVTSSCLLPEHRLSIATDMRSISIFDYLSGKKTTTLYHITDLHVAGCCFKGIEASDEVRSILYQNHALLE